MTRGQTGQLKKAFLIDFAQTGNVTESCENVGVARSTVYLWQELDDQFVAGWRESEIMATERLETAARRRAVDGVTTTTPIFHQGQRIYDIEETKYSDTLLIFLLKARAPEKYRDNVTVTLQVRAEAERIAAKLGKTAEEVLALAGVTGSR